MEVVGQLPASAARFTTKIRVPVTHSIGGCGGPRVALNAVEKGKIFRNFENRTPTSRSSSPQSSLYTDWAIPAPIHNETLSNKQSENLSLPVIETDVLWQIHLPNLYAHFLFPHPFPYVQSIINFYNLLT
jgi:hypothetical protein